MNIEVKEKGAIIAFNPSLFIIRGGFKMAAIAAEFEPRKPLFSVFDIRHSGKYKIVGKALMDLKTMTKWTIDCTGCSWLILLAILALGALGCGQLLYPFTDAPGVDKFRFEQYELVTGSAKHQTVFPGSFLGGATTELAVVSTDESDLRSLRIYALGNGSWSAVLDARLRSEVLFVDMAKIGGRDRLITFEPGRLNWFDPDSKTERGLVEVAMNYNATDKGKILHVDITRDVNHDGLDDLVIPDVNGFWISTQLSDSSFTGPVKLGPPEPFRDETAMGDPRNYGEQGISALTVPWYMSRVHEMDYDHDGRNDLVFWNEDHFDVYLQDEQGRFDSKAVSFSVDVPFDSDGAYSLAFGFSDESTFALISGFRKKSQRTVVYALRDMNGDDVADLVTLTLSGRSIAKQRSVYRVHFGTSTPEGTSFTRDVSSTINARGRAGGLLPWGYASELVQDFNGDGQVDLMFSHVSVGIGGMMRAMVCKSTAIDLEFYCPKDGSYADKPTATRKIRPDLDPLYGGVFFPPVLIGDVNGDGCVDLLTGQNPNELHAFAGVPGPNLFARRPQKLAVKLPADERNARLADLNRDGKQDIIIKHPSGTEPHRVTLLVAQ